MSDETCIRLRMPAKRSDASPSRTRSSDTSTRQGLRVRAMPGIAKVVGHPLWRRARPRKRADDDVGAFTGQILSHQMAQASLDAIACHRVAHLLGDDKTHPHHGWILLRLAPHVHHDRWARGPRPSTNGGGELARPLESVRRRKHRSGLVQADNSERPLRRRALKIERPARVRIRVRNPWVRLRRRLLG